MVISLPVGMLAADSVIELLTQVASYYALDFQPHPTTIKIAV
jgi:hypothetical protein